MGGQTLLDNAIHLNMLGFNKVTYDKQKKVVTAPAGATWQKVQAILTAHNRSIKVMQSDNIFTMGGSISVNAHGWQVAASPIASSIISMTVMTVDGQIKKLSKINQSELFKAVIGGYGLFAIILKAELETIDNSSVNFHSHFTLAKHLSAEYKKYISNIQKQT